jgi:hypothetical protein
MVTPVVMVLVEMVSVQRMLRAFVSLRKKGIVLFVHAREYLGDLVKMGQVPMGVVLVQLQNILSASRLET